MKYLSFDIEATGLNENCLIIEFAAVPFCTETKTIQKDLSYHHYIKCPSFDELKPTLDEWVIKHNRSLIEKAHDQGLNLLDWKNSLTEYLTSAPIVEYFGQGKITLFGKSMNAIDLPFLNRDLGWNFMRQYFNHKVLDLSSVAFALIDTKYLAPGQDSSSELMKLHQMGDVAHTALEDAINTAHIYLALIERAKNKI